MGVGSSTHIEAMDFPPVDNSTIVSEGFFLGTDIMDLFNYCIPSIDPVFYQGATNYNDMMEAESAGNLGWTNNPANWGSMDAN